MKPAPKALERFLLSFAQVYAERHHRDSECTWTERRRIKRDTKEALRRARAKVVDVG